MSVDPFLALTVSATDTEREIFSSRVRELYRLSRVDYVGTLCSACIVTLALWGHVEEIRLLTWLAVVIAAIGARFALYRSYFARKPPAEEAELWCKRFIVGTTTMGCLWGVAGSALLPAEDMLRQFLVTFLITGMVAGALVVLTPVKRAFLSFMLPALAPIILAVLAQGDVPHFIMGLLILVYMVVTLGAHLVMHDTHVETLRMRYESSGLVTRLSETHRQAEQANRQLVDRIAQQQRTEEALRQSTSRIEALIDASPLAIVVLDRNAAVTRWNRAAERIFGWNEAEVLGRVAPGVPPEQKEEFEHRQATILSGKAVPDAETVCCRKDERRIHVNISTAAVCNAGGEAVGIILIIADITDRRRAERGRALEHEVTRLLSEAHNLADAMREVLAAVCRATDCAYGARWACETDDGLLRCCETFGEDDAAFAEFHASARGAQRAPDIQSGLLRQVWNTGEPVWVEDLVEFAEADRYEAALRAGLQSAFAFPIVVGGAFFGVMEFFARDRRPRDEALLQAMRVLTSQVGQFIARKYAESDLSFFANHDALTGLLNRAMFSQHLEQTLAQAGRRERRLAVLLTDLDRFKVINSTLGHDAGDRLLKELADRLRKTLRGEDVLGRQGGDEFAVLIKDFETSDHVAAVAQKILDTLVRPLDLDGQEFSITASVGISIYPDDGRDVPTLLRNADIAMYRAKEGGKNGYRFYAAQMSGHSVERLTLETRLRRALERDEFLLHYQPKIDMLTRRIVGVEALARWQQPDLGMVSPAEFIPVAEETGLIGALGEWVLQTACAQVKTWQRAGLPPLRMAVNLSARQFAHPNLPETVAAVLHASNVDSRLMEFEITESMMMQDPESAAAIIGRLKTLGAHIAIDDFGTGYSSLGYLKRFPVDMVKVDRSFINGLPEDGDDAIIARAVIAMAHSLDLRVTAEGVETEAQLGFLREQGCDEAQGYLFSKPVPAGQLAAMLAQSGTRLH